MESEIAAEVPPLAEFERVLEAAAAEGGLLGVDAVDLKALDDLLATDDFELASLETGAPSLEDLVRLAERYPGLKVTLSF